MKEFANQPTKEERELSKKMTTIAEAERRIVEAGGFFVFQKIIDDPIFRSDLVQYARDYISNFLNYATLLKWLQDNNLERFLSGGSLEKSIAEQEKFYQNFYGKNFFINRKKIIVDSKRLSAIKAGLEMGCLNYAEIIATSDILLKEEMQMTEAEFFFERIMKPLKKEGFKIWAEEGTDRWTNLKLKELLQRGNPAEPEEFNAEAFKKEWSNEIIKILSQKSSPPKVRAGIVELNFTSNLVDISKDQVIINKDGEKVTPDDRSYVSAIASGVRVLSHAEGIILTSQMFSKDKTYLAPNTWEWRRDLIDHRDKGTSSNVSVANVARTAVSSGSTPIMPTTPMTTTDCGLPYNFGEMPKADMVMDLFREAE